MKWGGLLLFWSYFSFGQSPAVGVVTNFENAALLKGSGYDFIVESVARTISPRSVTEEQFEKNLTAFQKLPIPIYAFNIFLPGDLKVVGPDVSEEKITSYTEEVFRRCARANVHLIVWGSSGSRKLPDGFSREMAESQFVSIASQLARLAQKYDITLAIENLNRSETNFLNSVEEVLAVVQRVNHPNLRLCADIYHMLREGEGPAILEKASNYLVHCDLAEREDRTPPGVHGDDFRPHLDMLRRIDYRGKIVLECNWQDLPKQAGPALAILQQQMK